MENKYVGYILVGISLLMTIIIFMFQSALTSFVDSSCTLAHGGNYCPMYDTIDKQTYLSLSIVGVLILVALIMIFSKPGEKVIIKTRTIEKKVKKKEIDTSNLTKEEKQVLSVLVQNKTMFQADLIEKTNFGKSKMTRILDRLEGNGFIERKRRGMTNVIVIKE
jgi:uncharacterized membrane protein